MTARLPVHLVISVALATVAIAQSPPFPFATVTLRDSSIVATLSSNRRWLVKRDSAEPRLTSFGESFELREGTSLSLVERHSSYRVTCHISPPPAGLQVESTFDAHSFGGTTTKKSSFIKAQ
jgi:hypothetical protein